MTLGRHSDRRPRNAAGAPDPAFLSGPLDPPACLWLYMTLWQASEQHARAYTMSRHYPWPHDGRRPPRFHDAQAAETMRVRRDYVRRLRGDASDFIFGLWFEGKETMFSLGVRAGAQSLRAGLLDRVYPAVRRVYPAVYRHDWAVMFDATLAMELERSGIDARELCKDPADREHLSTVSATMQ